ncbi:MAG: hypothetical protein OWQ59_09280 [Alicyclobacillaceae bacterium]|jgi:hypothetical protein|nr:hypothetical protein [Alicyclobacillaceae bacterium]
MLRGAILMTAALAVPAALVAQVAHQPTKTTGKQPVYYAANVMGSKNWAGYVDLANNGQLLRTVTGSWQVPSVHGAEQSAAAQWIGLGGVQTTDLLQMGTVETVQNGQASNVLFWEKLPGAAHDWVSLPAGATVSASIQPVPGQQGMFELKATVTANGQSKTFTKYVPVSYTYASQMEQSAEWISEDPSNQNLSLVPLANMGTIHYSDATANGQPIVQSDASTQRMVLVDPNQDTALIRPSGLTNGYTAFTTKPTGNSVSGETQGPQPVTIIQVPTGPLPASNVGPAWQQWQQIQQQLQQQLKQAFGNSGSQWESEMPSSAQWNAIQNQLNQQLQEAVSQFQSMWSNAQHNPSVQSWNPFDYMSKKENTETAHGTSNGWKWTVQVTQW